MTLLENCKNIYLSQMVVVFEFKLPRTSPQIKEMFPKSLVIARNHNESPGIAPRSCKKFLEVPRKHLNCLKLEKIK